MKKFLYLLLGCASLASAQQVQWASKLIKFSSDLGGKQNGIKRILGKPDAFPQCGPSPNAWSPKKALDGSEWVVVGFDHPQAVKQIAVFENLNSGCVVRVQADDGSGSFKTVWSRGWAVRQNLYTYSFQRDRAYYYGRKRRKIQKAPEVDVNPGVERILLETTLPTVVALRVEFNFAVVPGQKQIDAIGISDSDAPLDATIHTDAAFATLVPSDVGLAGLTPGSPCLTPDGQVLYISDIGETHDAVVSYTKGPDGRWTNRKDEPLLSREKGFNYIEFAGSDFVLKGGVPFAKGGTESGYELLRRVGSDYVSTGPVRIVAYNNYDDTSDATMSADGKVLILGIETDFTQGGSDLYFALRKDDGTYGMLQNMGKQVNSAADEGMPQLLSDGRTLLFSSEGYSGYGDFDLYVTHRLDDTWKNWSEPINLGGAINGNDFDGQPYYDETAQVLYYVASVGGTPVLRQVPLPIALLAAP
ncbi:MULTISPECIES: hypothetical protein [unclassified Flavobacterium]|uniref:hypothetical protein n=1 Tax=unclassified Flavobacterium TaxID=196869 RepID=UPI001F13FDA3|nr:MULTISPECIES: hypothetical protein [unclassified Flavobacterium]UMY66931.1 hypothetical protein MKO97_06000 [Flavobacterium sp. HJ-32-4]